MRLDDVAFTVQFVYNMAQSTPVPSTAAGRVVSKRKGSMVAATRIGDMNARWALLFKMVMVLIPAVNCLFIPWAVWVTTHVWEATTHMRQESEVGESIKSICAEHRRDMETIRLDLRELDRRVMDSPPEIWKAKIGVLEADIRQNTADHAKILISLELIKQKLGVETVASR
jgi:hypothetical protein